MLSENVGTDSMWVTTQTWVLQRSHVCQSVLQPEGRSEAPCRWEESMSASLEVLEPLIQVVQSLLYPANSSAMATQLLANAVHSMVVAPQLLHDAIKFCTLTMELCLCVVQDLQ